MARRTPSAEVRKYWESLQELPGYNNVDISIESTYPFAMFHCLNPITQGSGKGNRVGNVITYLGFELRLQHASAKDLVPVFSGTLRVLALRTPAGNTPQLAEIFVGGDSFTGPFETDYIPNSYEILLDEILPPLQFDNAGELKQDYAYLYDFSTWLVHFTDAVQTPTSDIHDNLLLYIFIDTQTTVVGSWLRIHYLE